MLTKTDIEIVKSTAPLLEQGGSLITTHFYERMFKHNPEVKDIFNMSNQHTGRQRVALFEAILAYAQNLDNLAELKQTVERIANKHASFYIQPAHYDIVGHHLIETFRELLPEQFTTDVENAWLKAYQVLAGVFINREEQIYRDNEAQIGGWRGKRVFKLISKTVESQLVTSFVFEPVDLNPVADYLPGQYIGIEINDAKLANTEIRQYSLSDKANGKTYRISVKRELGEPPGRVSNYLHDNLNVGDLVDLYAPTGDFFFTDQQAPIALISAGVGLTPMQAMLENKHAIKYPHPVHYIHACKNQAQHSFAKRTETLCHYNNWHLSTWYRDDKDNTNNNIKHGFIDFSQESLPIENGHFYLCGPVQFMAFAKSELLELGVAATRIHYEVFGPHANL